MIKPALIAYTDSNHSILEYIFDIIFEALLLITTTTLAYITFNKKYKYLNKINFIKNSKYFSYLYIFNYIITLISTYSIAILVIIFDWVSNGDMNEFNWEMVIYPQCCWLLFIKLYFNEISNIISMIETYNKQFHSNSSNKIDDIHIKYRLIQSMNKLFIFQMSVIVGALISFVCYIGFAASTVTKHVRKGFKYKNSSWDMVVYWQLLLSFIILVTMPIAAVCGRNRNVKQELNENKACGCKYLHEHILATLVILFTVLLFFVSKY